MRTYVDPNGRSWPIRITVATLRRTKDTVDLANPEAWLDDVYRDPCRLGEIVFAIAGPLTGLSLSDLEECLTGEEIGKLRSLLFEELIDFFHDRTGRGELLAATIAQMTTGIQTAVAAAVQEITSLSTDCSANSESMAEN